MLISTIILLNRVLSKPQRQMGVLRKSSGAQLLNLSPSSSSHVPQPPVPLHLGFPRTVWGCLSSPYWMRTMCVSYWIHISLFGNISYVAYERRFRFGFPTPAHQATSKQNNNNNYQVHTKTKKNIKHSHCASQSSLLFVTGSHKVRDWKSVLETLTS